MPALINIAEAKAAALAELAEEDFKKAVAAIKADMKVARQHFLPWQIIFQWPIVFKPWTAKK